MRHNGVWWAALIIAIIFAPIVFPYKWVRNAIIKTRRRHEMALAKERSKHTDARIYVVQWGSDYYHGTKTELRRTDKRMSRYISRHVSRALQSDFRNAVVAVYWHGEPYNSNDQ